MRILTPWVGSLIIHGLCLGLGLGWGAPRASGQLPRRAAWVSVQLESAKSGSAIRPTSLAGRQASQPAKMTRDEPVPVAPAPQGTGVPSDSVSLVILKSGGRPQYPSISRRNGEEGEVAVKLRIGPQGEVLDAALAKSSGFSRLDASALAFLRQAKFEVPPSLASLGMPIEKTFSVVFELSQRDSRSDSMN